MKKYSLTLLTCLFFVLVVGLSWAGVLSSYTQLVLMFVGVNIDYWNPSETARIIQRLQAIESDEFIAFPRPYHRVATTSGKETTEIF